MLRYTQKDIIYIEDKDFANDLNGKRIKSDTVVRECDYCGELIQRKKVGNYSRMYSEIYVDEDSEYPCTDDCCMKCSGEKKKMIFFLKHGTTQNLNMFKTKEKNGKVPSSRPQIYLSKLLDARHNVYIRNIGYLDMVIEDRKVVIEYDGSGHFAGIHYGRYTYEEKIEQDKERDEQVKNLGYRIIRIDSKSDYLPSDTEILSEIKVIVEHFDITGEDFHYWEIPKNKKRSRYNQLRKITEEDIAWHREKFCRHNDTI